MIGTTTPAVATQPLPGWQAWALLMTGAIATAAAAAAAVMLSQPSPERRPPGDPPEQNPWPRRTRIAGVTLLLLAAAAAVGIYLPQGIGAVRSQLRGCMIPVEVPVVASPETYATAVRLGRSFELATARANGDCPSTRLSVYAADPTMVRRGLTSSWRVLDTGAEQFDYLRDLGPRPQLWMPDSSVDVDRMIRILTTMGAPSPLGSPRIYSWSPLTLAVRNDAADLPTAGSWPGLIGNYTGDGYSVIRADPKSSVTGEISLTATYPEVPGTAGPAAGDRARQIEAELTAGRERAGYPLGDSATLLRTYQRTGCDPPDRIALLLPEQFARQPQLAGPGIRADLGCPEPARQLVALTPPPTSPILNHPVVPLLWEDHDVTEPAGQRVAEFIAWLGTDAGRTAIEGTGLHPGAHPVPVDPEQPTGGLDPALLRRVDAAAQQQARAARPVQLILAIDTSGSMATRFDLATAVLDGTAERLSDSDLLGLVTFGGDRARVLVPPGTAGPGTAGADGTREQVRTRLNQLQPQGGTPLLQGLQQGISSLAGTPSSADPIKALVVVTDGRDSRGRPAVSTVAEQAERSGVRVYAVATGRADCEQPALDSVTRRSGGDCLVAVGGPEASADALASLIWAGTDD